MNAAVHWGFPQTGPPAFDRSIALDWRPVDPPSRAVAFQPNRVWPVNDFPPSAVIHPPSFSLFFCEYLIPANLAPFPCSTNNGPRFLLLTTVLFFSVRKFGISSFPPTLGSIGLGFDFVLRQYSLPLTHAKSCMPFSLFFAFRNSFPRRILCVFLGCQLISFNPLYQPLMAMSSSSVFSTAWAAHLLVFFQGRTRSLRRHQFGGDTKASLSPPIYPESLPLSPHRRVYFTPSPTAGTATR